MATPKNVDTPEKKPAEKPDLPKLFEQLGAPLFNSEWSRGAMHANGTVYLLAEPNEIDQDSVLVYKAGEEEQSKADSERLMHIARIKAGHPCMLVIGGKLFVGGQLSEEDGEVRIAKGPALDTEEI